MPKVTWCLADASTIVADVAVGHNLMEAAIENNVPEVLGECGGCLSCATCHVYVHEDWAERVGNPDEIEDAMLEVTDAPRNERSRLSCQIVMSDDLDGIMIEVPTPA